MTGPEPNNANLVRPSAAGARRCAWSCVGAASLASLVAIGLPGVHLLGWAIVAFVAAVASRLAPARFAGPLLLVVVFGFAGAWFGLRTGTWPAGSLAAATGGERAIVAVHGTVRSDPEPRRQTRDTLGRFRRGSTSLAFDLDAEWLELDAGSSVPISGRARVYVNTAPGEVLDIARGDRVRVMGWLTPPTGPSNPGEPDRLRWARMSNDAGTISVSSAELITPTADRRDPGSWLGGRIASLRARSLDLIAGEGGNEKGRAVLSALLLGEREAALEETTTAFQRTGTAHLLAISGFHLAILTLLGLYAVRLTGDRGRLEPLIVAALIVLILLLVPARVPIVRAGVMAIALLVGDAIGRRYDRLTMLGWIALGLFFWRPMDVFSLGAQLSIGITALLLWVAARRHPWVAPVRILGLRSTRLSLARRLLIWFRSALAVCVMCWLVSLPIVAMHTGIVSLSGAVTTVLVTPVVIALLGGGYLTLAVGTVLPGPATAALAVLAGIAEWTARLVSSIADLPGLSFEVAPPSALWAGAAVATVLLYLHRARVLSAGPLAAAVVLTGWIVVQNTTPRSLPASVVLRIDVLSVSDGSCLFVRSGGDAMLWDCGSLHRDLSPILERAAPALGLGRVRTAMITHANLDHYLAVPDAADIVGVERVLVSPHVLTDPATPVRALHAELAARDITAEPIAAGFEMALGRARLEILWPTSAADGFDENDRSLVARLTVPTAAGDRRVLLVGDIEGPAMEALLADPAAIRADILEAPHHGSFKPAAQRFVAAVGPGVVVQSTGASRVDDPRWAGERLRSRWLCTASDGAITIEIMRDGSIRASTMR